MNRRRPIIGLVISAATCTVLAVLVPAAATPAWGGAPTISVTPDLAAPGSTVTISGQSTETGGGTCEVSVDGKVADADCSYDRSGAVTASLRLSDGLRPGQATVAVCLPLCGDAAWSASTVLDIGATVPDVLGSQSSEAAAVIGRAGLTAVLAEGSPRDGAVIRQNPKGGSLAVPGSEVLIVLEGAPPKQIKVPNLLRMTLKQATAAVSDLPLQIRGDGVGSDIVTAQDPSPPATLPPDGIVTVQLAPADEGPGTVVVPRVVDAEVGAAGDKLGALGLKLEVAGATVQGRVATQDPVEGAKVEPGTTVIVTLAPLVIPSTDVPPSTTETSIPTTESPGSTESPTPTSNSPGIESSTTTASPASAVAETIAVPNITNKSLADAEKALADVGLGIGKPDDSSPTESVSAQHPAAGVLVTRGAVVSVDVLTEVVPVSSEPSKWSLLLTILAGLAGLAAGAVGIHFLKKRPRGPRWVSRHVTVAAKRGSVVTGSEPERSAPDDHDRSFALVGHRHECSITVQEELS